MIIVRLHEDFDVDFLGRKLTQSPKILWVDHGIDYDTLENVCLPAEKWSDFKKHCVHFKSIGEWVVF